MMRASRTRFLTAADFKSRSSELNLAAAKLCSGAAQRGADRILRDPEDGADLAIAAPFQVVLSNDFGIHVWKTGEHLLQLVAIIDPLHFTAVRAGEVNRRLMGMDVSQSFGHATLGHLTHHDPPCDDRQIGRQRAIAPKLPQDSKVAIEQRNKHLGAEVVDIAISEVHAARVSRVLHDMDKQPEKTVDKIVPTAGLTGQAASQ